MTTAEWNKEKWGADKNLLRGIETISLSCEAKTVTDKANNTTKCQGRTLEKLTVSFSTAIATGGDPLKEQKQLEKQAGESAPFYCGEEQLGDNDFILEAVRLREGLINTKGDCLTAKFELSFIEDASSQELDGAEKSEATKENETALKITYQGENIAPKISIKKIYYTQYAESHADVLELHFNDTGKNWDRWDGGKIKGTEIALEYGAIKTGKMYINSCAPEGGVFVLKALSVPPSYNTTHTKSWEQITLEELAKEVAGNHGLGSKTFDTKNKKRKYVHQKNSGDFAFLLDRCNQEGACFVVYDGTLNLYDEKTIENAAAGAKVNIDETKFTTATPRVDNEGTVKELTAKNGRYTGTATDKDGAVVVTEVVAEPLESDAEAKDIATAHIRARNKGAKKIEITTDLREDISAGSVIEIETETKKTWKGAAFVYKLRHNLTENKTKIWARKPLNY
jgi:phage protein D